MRDILRWSVGAVSVLALVCGVVSLSLVNTYSSPPAMCLEPASPDCPPTIQQVTFALPGDSLELRFALALLALALALGLPVWITATWRAERRSVSLRPILMLVALLASTLLFVDVMIAGSQVAWLNAQHACLVNGSGAALACYAGAQGWLVALIGAGAAPIMGAIIAGAPAWAMALTQAARWRRWGWFAAVLLLSPVAALVYAGFGPTGPATSTPARSIAPLAPAT